MDTIKQNNVHGICVSVLVVVRNEEQYIEQCLVSILNQTFDPKRYEIIVVDGMSTDRTREIVERLINEHQDHQIRLLDNPQKILAPGWNIGIRESKGQIIIRIDGHGSIGRDFISKSVCVLREHPDAWVAGGYCKTVSSGYVGNVIAAAMSSPVGVGNAMFRLGNYEGYVDTIATGAYWRWVYDKIGMYDEELVRTEDDDLNRRIICAGGKIWLSKSIMSTYYSRSSLRKLWRQYFQYGFWRSRTIQKHRRPAVLRQVLPLLFVSSLVVLGLAGVFCKIALWLLGIEVAIYALGLLYGALDVGRKAGWKYALLAPIVFAILHFAYGLGSLWGIVRFVLLEGRFMPKPSDFKPSN